MMGEWIQRTMGPSYWGNPFVPGASYRFSAWVKVEDLEWNAYDSGPQVGVTFMQYNGPGAVSSGVPIEAGWSDPLFNLRRFTYTNKVDWTEISMVTIPAPSYALYAHLHLRFLGRGKASFSNVRWERQE